jgi:hypothetical protein
MNSMKREDAVNAEDVKAERLFEIDLSALDEVAGGGGPTNQFPVGPTP